MISSMKLFLRYYLVVVAGILLLPAVGEAQFSPVAPGFTDASVSNAHLQISPRYYEPNSTVTVQLQAFSMNTNGATIRWFIDGTENPNYRNERSLPVTVGELGEVQSVQAIISTPSGAEIPVTTILRPVRIDLLIEADTLTPAFYRGRSLPTSGSTVRVTALPFTGDGSTPSAFSYTWEVGEDVIAGGSRQGKNTVTFTPDFERAERVTVTVIDQSGTTIASRSIAIPINEPELYFYEVNPLRGLQEIALKDNQPFSGIEMEIRAEPYYISRGLADDTLHTEWKLGGKTVANPSRDPQQISLRRQQATGSFSLEFEIRNLNQLLQGVKESITLRF